MLEDFQRTLVKAFGWVFTVLPIGLRFFSIALLISVFFLLLGFRLLGALFLIIACFCAFFFRNPKRDVQFAEDEIACPADGTVLSVKTEDDPNSVVIRIFLSIFDVHVQRATVNGVIGDIFYHKGQFLFANNPNAAADNERNSARTATVLPMWNKLRVPLRGALNAGSNPPRKSKPAS